MSSVLHREAAFFVSFSLSTVPCLVLLLLELVLAALSPNSCHNQVDLPLAVPLGLDLLA